MTDAMPVPEINAPGDQAERVRRLTAGLIQMRDTIRDLGPVPPGPETGRALDLPPGWVPGYADAIDWRWVAGHIAEPGPGTAWMRPRVPLVVGEELTPLQQVLACVDSASGISAVLDIREWDFRNLELTVHLTRPVVGEWVAVEAETLISGAGSGVARSTLYDASGLLGISAQALLIRPRSA